MRRGLRNYIPGYIRCDLSLPIFRITATDSDQDLGAWLLHRRDDVEVPRHFLGRQDDDATDGRLERRRVVTDEHGFDDALQRLEKANAVLGRVVRQRGAAVGAAELLEPTLEKQERRFCRPVLGRRRR